MLARVARSCQNRAQRRVCAGAGQDVGIRGQHSPESTLARMEKKAEVVKLRRTGMTYDDITAATGTPRGTAARWVKEEMEAQAKELGREVRFLRAEALDRLGALLAACWDRATAGSYQHIAEARRIISDMADYTGAKVPVKFQLGVGDVDEVLAELQRELDRRAADLEGEIVPAAIDAPGAGATQPG